MTASPARRRTPGLTGLLIGATAMIAGSVVAEPVPYKPGAGGHGNLSVQTQNAPVRTQVLNLPKGRSAVIDLPVDAADVFVSNPAAADAVLRTPRRIFVLGVAPGQSDAIFFDGTGRQILNLSIRVDASTDQLTDTIHRLYPQSKVEAQSVNGFIILSGVVANAAEADAITRLASAFAGKPENVVNTLAIAGKDQVALKVRIVEVERSTIKQLGMSADVTYNSGTRSYSFGRANTFGTNGSYMGGTGLCYGQKGARTTNYSTGSNASDSTTVVNGVNNSVTNSLSNNNVQTTLSGSGVNYTNSLNGQFVQSGGTNTTTVTSDSTITDGTTSSNTNTVTNAVTAAASTAWSTITGNNIGGCLQAFERVGLVRTLAEPNLTAVSGEAAKFLAGGEFPIPVSQDSTGRITVEYKPFGVGLGFTPVVLSGGRISIKLSTEVSELTNNGAFTSGTLTMSALSVRRAETTVEMQSGSSLMIAGLLKSDYRQSIDSLPGLTNLPVLGSLFRSRDFQNEDSELVIIITPYIVSPTDPNAFQTPADNLQIASDPETIFLGRLNKSYKQKRGDTRPDQVAAAPYQAPIGYVIE
ncbi:type II and III secretion system protein family protein [Asticcacaulis sp. BYS171W]|uniref:Type II and III secretion system protein family protein n=1 Tax=Asticcacaulis aquaticus TaxID=2984212 RepID=A0ABT5HZ03_9CAUL|nr:type II and III secretion system protein family protein [Asticcacaulis aquaticus]MDC7685163.1 type II and III secretion system protein family protein [Asticcacaulis aquaticus]